MRAEADGEVGRDDHGPVAWVAKPADEVQDDLVLEMALAACALCCAGLTGFLKERFDDFFDGAVTELLSTHYPTREAVEAATWEEVEASLRRHQVSGGLSIERRRMLWDAYAQGVLS